MMKTALLFSMILLAGIAARAQDETYDTRSGNTETRDGEEAPSGDLYVIPFRDQLFNCHFSKQIMRHNGVTFEEMRSRMKSALMLRLTESLSDSLSALSYTDLTEETRTKNDHVAVNTMRFQYKELPAQEDDEDALNKVKKRLKDKNKKKREREGTYIQDGQIVSHRSDAQKYMSAVFEGEDLLYLLSEMYKSKFILSINQLDITIPPQAGQLQIQHGKFQRRVRAHYSVFTVNGEYLHGGIAAVEFPPDENDLEVICKDVFGELASGLAETFYASLPRE